MQWQAHNSRRVETESMRRASDIVGWANSRIGSHQAQLTDHEQRIRAGELRAMKQDTRHQLVMSMFRNGRAIGSGAFAAFKWVMVLILAYGLWTKQISIEGVKVFLSVLGWHVGS